MWHCTRWQVPLPRSRKNKNGDHMSTGEQMWYSVPCLVVWRSSHSGPGCTSNSRLRSQEWKPLWNLVQCVAQFPAGTSFQPKKRKFGYFRWDFNSSSTEPIRQKNKHHRYQLMVLVGFLVEKWAYNRDFVQGRVVRKPANVNPVLNVNWSITFSCWKMFFISNVWCSLRLLHLKTEGQTIWTEHHTKKLQNWNQNSR